MASRFKRASPSQRRTLRDRYGDAVFRELVTSWRWHARPEQRLPDKLPNGEDWFTWMIRTGRGWGKTRTGSESVAEVVEKGLHGRLMFMGKDIVDARQLMFEKGLLAGPYRFKPKRDRPYFKRDGSTIVWPNGAEAKVFGAEDIDQARGWQFSFAWLDEFAAFPKAERVWKEVVKYTVRLDGPTGDPPRVLITTTPKRKRILKEIAEDPTTVLTTGSSYDNEDNLSAQFFNEIRKAEGTSIGLQEIHGRQLGEVEGALWTQELLDKQRLRELPKDLDVVAAVVAVDPPGKSTGAEAGIIAGLLDFDGNIYVVEDRSLQGKPHRWGMAAVHLAVDVGAAVIVTEVNQGGEMVESVLQGALDAYNRDPSNDPALIKIVMVHAHLGKRARAEPIHQLYERGKVWHVGSFPELEDQQCTFTGATNEDSPDRYDAAVWLCTHLAASPEGADLRMRVDGLKELNRLSKSLMLRGRMR